jgi:ABC-type multidrug transport system fused ATPase/permease subunit
MAGSCIFNLRDSHSSQMALVINMLQSQLFMIMYSVTSVIKGMFFSFVSAEWEMITMDVGRVSLDRVNRFLHEVCFILSLRCPFLTMVQTELLDCFAQKADSRHITDESQLRGSSIGICDASFSWSTDSRASTRNFLLRIEGELLFSKNKINVILGPTGSGKTSLLMALLGGFFFYA